ncbi:MAG: hypothetical protein HY650_10245 [Acidobacteria bacterium]|nr:hypothetical protein [Acidobacteriota bacterium]
MKFRLKPISKSGVPEALSKVAHYRYLNQPAEAESICRDVLIADPENQLAVRLLGLVITDQFTGGRSDRYDEAERTFLSLTDPYERSYYLGIFYERRAKVQLTAGVPPHALLVLFERAMRCYEEAEAIHPAGNDDAILRWNRCVRLLQSRMGSEWRKEMEAIEATDSPPV